MEEELAVNKRRFSELSETLLIIAKEELGETDNIREECLSLLKEWIQTQNNDYSNLGNGLEHLSFFCLHFNNYIFVSIQMIYHYVGFSVAASLI